MGNIAPSIGRDNCKETRSFWTGIATRSRAWGSLLAEYRATFVVEAGVMVSQVCVYKLAAYFLGKEGFSEYAVARRTIALIYPVALVGLTVALPRFIARGGRSGAGRGSDGYFGAALWCVLGTLAAVLVMANMLSERASELFFGTVELSPLVFPLSILVAALALHTLTYGYFRGHLAMKSANTLQLINLGLIPPVVIVALGKSVRMILLELGILTLAVTGFTIVVFTPWREMLAVKRQRVKELLRYGLQRLPGDLALLGLLTLPTTITAHALGVQQAGLVAFGMLFLTIVSATLNPVGLILLPKASRMFALGATSALRGDVIRLVKATVILTGSISLGVGVLAAPLIHVYLGSGYAGAAVAVRYFAWGTVPYCLFLVLSHVIDAFHRNSVTAVIEIIAFIVASLGCCVDWFTARNVEGFLMSFVAGVSTLAVLSAFACFRIFRQAGIFYDDSHAEVAGIEGLPSE